MTPVQGIHPDGPVSEKGPSHSCDRFSGSLDTWIDLHPPILSDPLDTLEEVFGLGQKTSRDKQIRFLSVFLNRAENDAWPWIGEKPTPLTRLKAGNLFEDWEATMASLQNESNCWVYSKMKLKDVYSLEGKL